MKCGIESLLAWEKKQQAKRLVVNSPDQKEVAKAIRKTLKAQGFSSAIIAKNIKMAMELI